MDLPHRTYIIIHMLKHMVGNHQIEAFRIAGYGHKVHTLNVGSHRKQISLAVIPRASLCDDARQMPLWSKVQHSKIRQSLHDPCSPHIKNQMPFPVMGPAPRALELIEIATNHFKRSHQGGRFPPSP